MKKIYILFGIIFLIGLIAVVIVVNYSRPESQLDQIPVIQPSNSTTTEIEQDVDIDNAIELIRKEYPKLAGATDNISKGTITSIKEVLDGWTVQIHWGWCPDCFCIFHIFSNGEIQKLDKGDCPYNKDE